MAFRGAVGRDDEKTVPRRPPSPVADGPSLDLGRGPNGPSPRGRMSVGSGRRPAPSWPAPEPSRRQRTPPRDSPPSGVGAEEEQRRARRDSVGGPRGRRGEQFRRAREQVAASQGKGPCADERMFHQGHDFHNPRPSPPLLWRAALHISSVVRASRGATTATFFLKEPGAPGRKYLVREKSVKWHIPGPGAGRGGSIHGDGVCHLLGLRIFWGLLGALFGTFFIVTPAGPRAPWCSGWASSSTWAKPGGLTKSRCRFIESTFAGRLNMAPLATAECPRSETKTEDNTCSSTSIGPPCQLPRVLPDKVYDAFYRLTDAEHANPGRSSSTWVRAAGAADQASTTCFEKEGRGSRTRSSKSELSHVMGRFSVTGSSKALVTDNRPRRQGQGGDERDQHAVPGGLRVGGDGEGRGRFGSWKVKVGGRPEAQSKALSRARASPDQRAGDPSTACASRWDGTFAKAGAGGDAAGT